MDSGSTPEKAKGAGAWVRRKLQGLLGLHSSGIGATTCTTTQARLELHSPCTMSQLQTLLSDSSTAYTTIDVHGCTIKGMPHTRSSAGVTTAVAGPGSGCAESPDMYSIPSVAVTLAAHSHAGKEYSKQPTSTSINSDSGHNTAGGSHSQSALILDQPGVTLCNGTLCLPAHASLRITGPGIVLQDMKICGRGAPGGSLIEVVGSGHVTLIRCKIMVDSFGEAGAHGCSGVHIHSGGTAHLLSCKVRSTRGSGVVVSGPGSSCVLSASQLSRCGKHGLAVLQGGTAEVAGCTASGNGGIGMLARDGATISQVGDGCAASFNKRSGFVADGGSMQLTGGRCVAMCNRVHGYAARGAGAVLSTGPETQALYNKEDGFTARRGAKLHVGEAARASFNKTGGYTCAGDAATATVGCGSVASHNKAAGFIASDSGVMHVGNNCISKQNRKLAGFLCEGRGSVLTTGMAAQTRNNQKHGFLARDGGCMRIGLWAATGEAVGYCEEGEGTQLVRSEAHCM